MDYFQKTEMSSTTAINCTPDLYSAYADSFDLSLLSTDDREPSTLSSSIATDTNKCESNDYIPTTIFSNNETNQIQPIIKTEKLWNCDSTIPLQNNNNNNYNFSTNYSQQFGQDDSTSTAASLLFQQLQKQYQFYPSPLPSPPQYEFCNLNSISSSNNYNYSLYSPASSTLSPSPCPSLDYQLNSFGSNNCLNNNNNNNQNTTTQCYTQVKQEYLILPPSPPESNGSASPSLNEIKSEPGDHDIDSNLLEINNLLEKTLQNFEENQKYLQHQQQQQEENQRQLNNTIDQQPAQDHQLLREYLQDTSFQKKHNLKPLALESLIGGLGVRGDIEPVISLALEHAKRDAQATCAKLQISPDPQQWTTTQVHAWIRSTIEQFRLQQINELENKFPENGANLLCLTEDEFMRRVPESGATIHAQLEIWKLACCDNFLMDMFQCGPLTNNSTSNNNNNNSWQTNDCEMDVTDDEDEDMEPQSSITSLEPANNLTKENGQHEIASTSEVSTNTLPTISPSSPEINIGTVKPTALINNTTNQTATTAASVSTSQTTTPTTTTKTPRTGGSHIHLWQFLKELLAAPQIHGTAIRWLDRNKGVFKIEDSVRVAKLWGRRKNRPAMNYDKLSRSIRQYYKKGIMKKTERSQRLVYQFCHPYCL